MNNRAEDAQMSSLVQLFPFLKITGSVSDCHTDIQRTSATDELAILGMHGAEVKCIKFWGSLYKALFTETNANGIG